MTSGTLAHLFSKKLALVKSTISARGGTGFGGNREGSGTLVLVTTGFKTAYLNQIVH